MSALDRQVQGSHYKGLRIQPVEFIMANQMGFCEGNVIKYVTRWRDKGGVDDLRKARHFLEFIQEDKDYQAGLEGKYPSKSSTPEEYIAANGIKNPEAGVIRHVWTWSVNSDASNLRSALKWLDELIEEETTVGERGGVGEREGHTESVGAGQAAEPGT